MDIIVQKFGGTSVTTNERREKVANKVICTKKEGKYPVVVVSAIGRSGDPYATDTLINFANSIYKEYESRELDMIMACGEIISSVILANTIKSMGYMAVALTGYQAGIITDNNYGDAEVLKVDTTNIINFLKKGYIPVITGFQGATENKDITTLGRGGSDTTAAILGEALNASVVEIYTDVDGVMTADPRLVSEAKVIDSISYDEIYQMAEDGAKVIHPRAVAIAKRGNIPLKVKNTLSDGPGTIIHNKELYNDRYSKNISKDDILTAIAHKNNIAQVNVYFEDSIEANELLMNALTKNNISIDLINFFTDKKVFTIDKKNIEKIEKILEEHNFKYKIVNDCSKITVIGHKMRGIPGVMAKIVKALSKQGIKILQTSDSHNTISCLVKDADTKNAVIALHKEFNLSKK
ncbi:aspartate kinase [Crassaminicella thermophila]|uniref:Aspartokinase n=1 Tax=Crassaminicella thermophila TaxID=2599308 RepID=A0A5C0SD92_CRATE|nr:aspartate kinase [Crassaminicella thermophila]QEK12221.1 aspartate kinase [Crassaminicella thermophila]